jgi:hypothetical protein
VNEPAPGPIAVGSGGGLVVRRRAGRSSAAPGPVHSAAGSTPVRATREYQWALALGMRVPVG